jgi:hypothetical protein
LAALIGKLARKAIRVRLSAPYPCLGLKTAKSKKSKSQNYSDPQRRLLEDLFMSAIGS